MFDVAVIGVVILGMATAARLRAHGLSVIVFEAHGQPGGCAGFFRRRGFAFDVGATTLVDFEPGGVGGELLETIGMAPVAGERLPGYRAWLPDRVVTLHRDPTAWAAERLRVLGDSAAHRRFWRLMDRLADVFWRASRAGVKLPIESISDLVRAINCVGLPNLPLARFLGRTMGDALRSYGLRNNRPLAGLLSMLLEDTVHARLDDAPLLNAALGATIRGAGLTPARGGMYGFWRRFVAHFRRMGGVLRVGCPVHKIEGGSPRGRPYRIHTRHGVFEATQVVSAVPAVLTAPGAAGRGGVLAAVPPPRRRRARRRLRRLPRRAARRGRRPIVYTSPTVARLRRAAGQRQQHVRFRFGARRRGKRPARLPRGDDLDALRVRRMAKSGYGRLRTAKVGNGPTSDRAGAAGLPGPGTAGGRL